VTNDLHSLDRQAAAIAADPLVAESFGLWLALLWRTLRRSWRPLLLIVALTVSLPNVVFAVILRHVDARGFHDFGHAQFFVVVVWVVTSYAGALAWAAAQWTLVQQAVAAPARLRDAIAYASRNGIRVWGLLMFYRLTVGIGLFFFWLLPGLYLALSFALLVPVALVEPGASPFRSSFRMVNRNLGAALGRLSLVYVPAFAVAAFVMITSHWQFGASAIVPQSTKSVDLATLVTTTLAQVPTEMIVIVGVFLTYVHLRARTRPTTSMDLADALAAQSRWT
jgi:hypothetical protein